MSPIYRYSCCGKEIEVIQGFDKDTPKCPDCEAEMLKLPTSPALVTMKGTHSKGYKEGYAKDYRRRLQEKRS